MTTTAVLTHHTPVGPLTLAASGRGLTRCTFDPISSGADDVPTSSDARAWLDLARHEIDAYFTGELRRFSVLVDLRQVASPHRRILDALGEVGYGETTTYGALAAELGLTDDGPRRVGKAMARNPVLIVVPCHRVLGVHGKLTGYAGGIATKQALLELESRDGATQLTLAM